MAGEWRDALLQELAEDITVGYVGPMASEYVPEGIPFLRSQNVEPLRINETDLKFITPEFHGRLRKSALLPGDVVIVRTGKPGACAVIPNNFPVANCSDLVIVRCGPELDPRFLAFYVNSVAEHHINSHLVGAVQQHFNVGSARTLLMRLPDLQGQRAIAQILGTLDDKIELNRRMSETLEAMARALFKSWFVDFDPVHAKAEGRDTGLPKSLADLFPDSFQDSELGEIPTGWRTAPIGEVVTAVGGSTPSTVEPAFWDEGTINFATPKDLAALSSPVLLETERRITTAGLAKISSGLLPRGTVLLSSRAPIGYLAITEIPLAVNQGFIAMVCNKGLPSTYVLHWLQKNMETILGNANGTTFLEISKASFRPIPAIVPAAEVLKAFSSILAPWCSQIVANLTESRTLATLRDSLLPKLISGELRPEDAARFESRHTPGMAEVLR